MPSIRRSLIGYVLLLLALALGGVGLLVDRLAVDALHAREAASESRIEQEYDLRCKETRQQFDDELLTQAKTLAPDLGRRLFTIISRGGGGPNRPADDEPTQLRRPLGASDDELIQLRRGLGALALGVGPTAWPSAPALIAVNNSRLRHQLYFHATLAPRLRAALDDSFEEDQHPGVFQVHLVGTPRIVVRPPGAPAGLPDDLGSLERWGPNLTPHFDDIALAGAGTYRRVVLRDAAHRPIPIWVNHLLGRGDRGLPDGLYRVIVQYARPVAELGARLEVHARNRDEQLAQVREETAVALGQLRVQVALIAGLTFVALAAGAWWLVARGLAPVRKLSDAVSRVSAQDFRLSVEPGDLSRELIPIHDRLTQTLDELRRAFAREKQAVADISHELRTPLAGLLASLDVALRKPRSAEQYKATLEECRQIGKELSRLVERILSLAALDAGRAQVHAEHLDAAEVAAGCAAVVRPLAASHGLTFEFDADAGVELVTDPDKLRDVLLNLLHNAVEYNRPGGSVRLTVTADGPHAVFEVADTGIGMTPEVREHVFERFYRADASRHATGVHAGLGLSLVKEYVDRLGGAITVTSTPDVGSTFRVTLPAAAAAGRTGTTPPPARPERTPVRVAE